MGVRICCDGREPIQVSLRKFKKRQEQAGLRREMRKTEHFVKRTQKRRTKQFKKRFKAREQSLQAQLAVTSSKEKRTSLIAQFWRKTGKP